LPVCWNDNPALVPISGSGPVNVSGPQATHQIACHNPPTAEESAAGRPLREGFVPAPPPGSVIEELAPTEEVLA